jgi:hypothetical protein
MSIDHHIMCRTCRLVRNLDTQYDLSLQDFPKCSDDVFEYQKGVEANPYRAALILSFLFEHQTHDVVLFAEYDTEIDDEVWPDDAVDVETGLAEGWKGDFDFRWPDSRRDP